METTEPRRQQLFKLVRNIRLPSYSRVSYGGSNYTSVSESIPAWFAMCWPNGTPCVLVEMHIAEKARTLTLRSSNGGSAKVVASKLCHLVRLCWDTGKTFGELCDDDIACFITDLRQEKKSGQPNRRKRNDNTINDIVASWIEFLEWIQSTIFTDRIIVGTRESGAQIICTEMTATDKYGNAKRVLRYSRRLPRNSERAKRPIGSAIRTALWEAAKALEQVATLARRYRARFSSDEVLGVERKYLRAREELLLALLEATGARPGELALLRMSDVIDCVTTGKIALITLKRGFDPVRHVPIDFSLCIRIQLFIQKHRSDLLERLAQRGICANDDDYLFLTSTKGTGMPAETLSKVFQRLVSRAGINQRACMSMFRHRFITMMIVLHLREFMDQNPGKTRALMTDSDYLTILKRVSQLTGHGDPNSLMSYLDLAWEELGTFNYVGPAFELVRGVDESIRTLEELASSLEDVKEAISADMLIQVRLQLRDIANRTKGAIDRAGGKRH